MLDIGEVFTEGDVQLFTAVQFLQSMTMDLVASKIDITPPHSPQSR